MAFLIPMIASALLTVVAVDPAVALAVRQASTKVTFGATCQSSLDCAGDLFCITGTCNCAGTQTLCAKMADHIQPLLYKDSNSTCCFNNSAAAAVQSTVSIGMIVGVVIAVLITVFIIGMIIYSIRTIRRGGSLFNTTVHVTAPDGIISQTGYGVGRATVTSTSPFGFSFQSVPVIHAVSPAPSVYNQNQNRQHFYRHNTHWSATEICEEGDRIRLHHCRPILAKNNGIPFPEEPHDDIFGDEVLKGRLGMFSLEGLEGIKCSPVGLEIQFCDSACNATKRNALLVSWQGAEEGPTVWRIIAPSQEHGTAGLVGDFRLGYIGTDLIPVTDSYSAQHLSKSPNRAKKRLTLPARRTVPSWDLGAAGVIRCPESFRVDTIRRAFLAPRSTSLQQHGTPNPVNRFHAPRNSWSRPSSGAGRQPANQVWIAMGIFSARMPSALAPGLVSYAQNTSPPPSSLTPSPPPSSLSSPTAAAIQSTVSIGMIVGIVVAIVIAIFVITMIVYTVRRLQRGESLFSTTVHVTGPDGTTIQTGYGVGRATVTSTSPFGFSVQSVPVIHAPAQPQGAAGQGQNPRYTVSAATVTTKSPFGFSFSTVPVIHQVPQQQDGPPEPKQAILERGWGDPKFYGFATGESMLFIAAIHFTLEPDRAFFLICLIEIVLTPPYSAFHFPECLFSAFAGDLKYFDRVLVLTAPRFQIRLLFIHVCYTLLIIWLFFDPTSPVQSTD
ncbi:hypothetical protein M427DRAFT_497547 [Gonapodya prolifera JEL478]|uniref:Extracellular membrane protein CFEM domain-containing protein n=1 Tax=Gonapodya prolifera (strain JEL478) TaxID=1344416 RepID=A0A139AEY6_GONPJ|nr:hypothetical protein M427DRAFT_497547 [Gonapodya prolifera JEL478]|eukprot:KXS15318.1 hypothetical protein M427DRAFT_497547 [Gonapodya prolifera JEL478]